MRASYVRGMEPLMVWLRSLGNAGAIRNAAALAQQRREHDFVVQSLTRRLRHVHADAAAGAA
jgi:hypothetical protein